MKKGKLICLLLVGIIFSCISAYTIIAIPEYDPKILEEFNRISEVPILVKLYSKNMTKVDEILSTLSEDEFKLERKLSLGNGFGGNITNEGFNKLINNSDIKMIYLDKPLHVVLDEEEEKEELDIINNNIVSQNFSILEEEQKGKSNGSKDKNQPLFWIIILSFVLIIVIYLIIKFRKKVRHHGRKK